MTGVVTRGRARVTDARWRAVVEYRTDHGVVDVEWWVEEIEDLQEILEAGPDWNTMERCVITYQRRRHDLTVEQSREK